jgi:hypothetical protein
MSLANRKVDELPTFSKVSSILYVVYHGLLLLARGDRRVQVSYDTAITLPCPICIHQLAKIWIK